MEKQIKIEIYLPPEFAEKMCAALTVIGACHVGKYDHVMAVTPVRGSWRPLLGSNPYEGKVGEVCTGEEWKMEVRCPELLVSQAIDVIRAIHPYEEPLINLIPLLNDQYGSN